MRLARFWLAAMLSLAPAAGGFAVDSLLIPETTARCLDDDGDPVSGCQIEVYAASTDAELDVFSDKELSDAAANPVESDASGEFPDRYIGTAAYKIVVKDTEGNTIKSRDNRPGAVNTTAFEVEAARPQEPVTATASNYVTDADDLGSIVDATTTGGNVTVTLLSAVTAENGGRIVVRKADSSANTVSVTTSGGETIDGASSASLTRQGETVTFVSNGSGWISKRELVSGAVTFARMATGAYSTSTTLTENSNSLFPTQAAVKSYVDNAVTSGVKWKSPVRAATTANGTLATAFDDASVIDDVTLATGDRILIKNQSSAAENGIYVVAASGAPTRATDADQAAELNGATVFVEEGTANAGSQWTQTATVVTVNTDTVTFTLIAAGVSYTAGTCLDLTGSQFSVEAGCIGTTQIATDGVASDEIAANAVGQSEIATDGVATAEILDGTIGTADLSATVLAKFTQSFIVAASDETTALTTGTAKVTWRMPYAFTVTAVRCSLTTSQSSGNIFTVDINESGSTILSTKVTIDNGESTSTSAVTAPVISDSSLADDASMTIDIDQIGNGTAKGLKCAIIGTKT